MCWLLWWKLSISTLSEMGKRGLELWLSYWEPLILISTEMKRTIVHSWAFLNINVMLSFTYHGFFFFVCLFLAKKCFLSSAVFNGTENGDEKEWLLLQAGVCTEALCSVSFLCVGCWGLGSVGAAGQCTWEAEREVHSRAVQGQCPHCTQSSSLTHHPIVVVWISLILVAF